MSTLDERRKAALEAAEGRRGPQEGLATEPAGYTGGIVFSDAQDRETRIKFGRLLDRGIVRDNGYREAAEAVETLLKMATNILASDDAKYQTIKASNALLQRRVLAVKGGHEYLIALGFRTQTVDFVKQYRFERTLRAVHVLEMGAGVLRDHLEALQRRAEQSQQSALAHRASEVSRRAAALADIEADRVVVQERAERERSGRVERVERVEQMERAERVERVEQAEDVDLSGGVDGSEQDLAVGEDSPAYGQSPWGSGHRLGIQVDFVAAREWETQVERVLIAVAQREMWNRRWNRMKRQDDPVNTPMNQKVA
nr:hypothetical protein L204_05010 [Cryptococcus depauperatus CBS 7855]